MAAMWCQYAALLLTFYAASTSAGGGRVTNFTVNGTYVVRSGGYHHVYAQSKIYLNCTAENLTSTSIVRIRKTNLANPLNFVTLSDNDEVDGAFSSDRFKAESVPGITSDVKSYVIEIGNLSEDDSANYTCGVTGRPNSTLPLYVLVNVSATPHFLCNKTILVDRKSGNLSIECPFFAYNLQSVATYWTCSTHEQVVLRLAGRTETSITETHVNVNYTLRLLPADPDKGIPYRLNFTISNIERVPELFKTTYFFKAQGDKGIAEHAITFRDPLQPQPGPVHGAAAKPQSWSFATLFLVAVIFGFL